MDRADDAETRRDMKPNRRHAAHGLKSSKNIDDPAVALREFCRALAVVAEGEEASRFPQELLGDACKELREAYGLTQQ